MDFSNLLKATILILFLSSCKTATEAYVDFEKLRENNETPIILIIENDGEYERDDQHFDQLLKASNYAKLPAVKMGLSQFQSTLKITPFTKVICVRETTSFTDKAVDSLHTFVSRGGTLFFTGSNVDERTAFLIGLKPSYTMGIDGAASGIAIKNESFLGNDLRLENTGKHLGLSASNFSNSINTVAVATNNPTYPLVTLNQVGNGKVVMYNSNIPFSGDTRGFAFALMLLGLESVPYPVANIANIHLNGLIGPANVSFATDKNGNQNRNEFLSEVWWTDMQRLAKKYDLKYTISPYLDTNLKISEVQKWWGLEAIKEGHELGLFGGLDASLIKNSTERAKIPFAKNVDQFIDVWETTKSEIPPTIYFSRTDSMDEGRLQKLKELAPSIKYLHQHSSNRNQEVSIAPNDSDSYYYDLPISSEGFDFDDTTKWAIHTQYLLTGYLNHSYFWSESELEHSTNTQKKRYGELDSALHDIRQSYPMIQFLTAGQGSYQISKWRYAHYSHANTDGLYVVSSNDYLNDQDFENYWHCYIDSEDDEVFSNDLEGSVMNHHKSKFLNGYLYQIKTDGAFISLNNLGDNVSGNDIQIKDFVFRERLKFERAKFELLPFLVKLDSYRNQGKLESASKLIEDHILAGNELPIGQWMDYIQMMNELGQTEELWNFLERQYALNPNEDGVFLGLKAKEMYEWPNEQIAESWLWKAIEYNIGGLPVLSEYANNHFSDDDLPKKKTVLQKISEVSDDAIHKQNYVAFLLKNNDTETVAFLNDIKPCQETYQLLATDIAEYYASKFLYERAYQWSLCSSNLDIATINEWKSNAKDYKSLKEKEPLTYYGGLLSSEKKKAYQELKAIPICAKQLQPLAAKIAQVFGDMGDYRGALSWSKCTDEVDIKNLLTWNNKMNNYTASKNLYRSYMENNKNAHDVSVHMANMSLETGDLVEVGNILRTLLAGPEYNELKSKLNASMQYSNLETRKKIIKSFPHLIDDDIKENVQEELRMQVGNDIFLRSNAIGNQFDVTSLSFFGGYAYRDKKDNIHELAAVRSFAYAIEDIFNEPENSDRNLLGLEYSFNRELQNDLSISFGGRFEGDNANKTFFHLNAELLKTNEKGSLGVRVAHRPVPTGPGYVQNIYQTTFDGKLSKKTGIGIDPMLWLNARYFSDENQDATFTGRLEYGLVDELTFKMVPFVEGSYALANTDIRSGFPYWIADDRLVAGGGLAFRIGDPSDTYFIDAHASFFTENQDQPDFQRYFAQMNFRIKKYVQLNAGIQYYTLDSYFGNTFNFGLRYDLGKFKKEF